MQIAIKDINIGKRYRQKVGDLADLKASMERLGLLQPIGIDKDKRLIFGQRRVEAARQLGWAVIECRVVDLEDPLAAERDENECRADFTLSEKVAIGKAIEEREREKAKERQGRPGSARSGKLPEHEKGESNGEGSRSHRRVAQHLREGEGDRRRGHAAGRGEDGRDGQGQRGPSGHAGPQGRAEAARPAQDPLQAVRARRGHEGLQGMRGGERSCQGGHERQEEPRGERGGAEARQAGVRRPALPEARRPARAVHRQPQAGHGRRPCRRGTRRVPGRARRRSGRVEAVAEGHDVMVPRLHQERGVADVLSAIEDGCRRVCLTSPTGGGKSLMMMMLVRWALAKDWRVGIYTNRNLLREQLSTGLSEAGIRHGIRAAGRGVDRRQDVQISSIQTEDSRVYKRSATTGWTLHNAKLALFDEAHLMKGKTAERVMADHLEAGAVIIGFTATPLDIGHLYDRLIVAGTVPELVKAGVLVRATHYGPDEPDTRKLKRTKTGEYREKDVRKAIMTPTIFGRVIEHWRKLNPNRRPSILFAPGVGESLWFMQQFIAEGVSAAHIDGKEIWIDGKAHARDDEGAAKALREGSRSGAIEVVCNRFVMREGIDYPWLEVGIFATIFGSLQSFVQSGGRLLRASPETGKTQAVIIDHGGNWWRHGSLNVSRTWELGESAYVRSELREDRLREKKEREPVVCPNCLRVRMPGADGNRCPYCGHEVGRKFRMVVQQDGRLQPFHGDVFRPKRVEMRADTAEKWKRMYFRARRSGMTFRQAEALYYLENYYYPPRDLHYMPRHDIDWFSAVPDVPHARLTAYEIPQKVHGG
jgi:DNA repair protein RadD